MSLSMRGHIDGVFKSVDATLTPKGGAYIDGIWVPVNSTPVSYRVNIQPLTDREKDFLERGGERIIDGRRIYVNSGDLNLITLEGDWEFLGQRFKAIRTDNRPWHDYCQVIVSRYDEQP